MFLPTLFAGIAITSCGSSSPPTQPTNTPRATAFAIINGHNGFSDIVLGPGEDIPIIGLTNTGPLGTSAQVPDNEIRLESSNPAVLAISGSHVVGVSPGEADLKATFQSLIATAHARVFAPSSIVKFVLYGKGPGTNPCWPNDQSSLGFDAVLEDGTHVGSSPTWRSSAPAVASVDANGNVTCLSPGQATIEVLYQGRSASTQYTVRVPQDAFEPRGSGATGTFERGRTVSISNSGFYVLESAASGQIVQTVLDDRGITLGTTTFPILHGSGEWHLTTTFVIPSTATSICERVIMKIDGSSREFQSPPRACIPVP